MDKARLLQKRADTATGLPEDDVTLPNGMGVVRIRGLNRIEAVYVQEGDGPAETERRALALALVDPVMTEDDVRAWQEVAPAGELTPVANRVTELSGMAADSQKEAVKEFVADPSLEFRVLPSAEAGDDGGRSPGEDE